MTRRLLTVFALAAGAAALSGCVVVPTEPAYGYGYGAAPGVRVVPPPVVVVPPPRHRYYYSRDYDAHGYDPRWH